MKRLLFFTLLVSAVTLLGFWGTKKACMLITWPGSVRPSQSWYFNLGLNTEQTESLKKLETSFRKETDKMCMQICEERLELLNLMRDSKTNPEIIYGKIEAIGAMQISLEKEIATHILKVKQNLTPEQSQAYLARIHEEMAQSIQRSGYGEILKQ